MKKIIKLTVINAGGEFTGGVIADEYTKEMLREKINEGSVDTSMKFDDETFFEASDHTSILHNYGPNIPGATILIEESHDIDKEDDYDREYDEISSSDIDETEVNQFSSSNPCFDDDTSDYSEDDLVFYSKKNEKRIQYPIVIEIDGDGFELSNVYIGSMNMDETISGDEIIEDVLYIPKNKAIEYTKEYLKDDYDSECSLIECLSDIFCNSELSELKEKIRNNHLIVPEEIEGKGEWENNYIKITDINGEVLFEE
ncbi:MAG: hypothetical protein PHN84_12520 [Desulfuromonadaceae bacterium]|nr:hypothetical protein [Desulfuromonadaceae bacterium]MDD2856777.1 hypothetical protein [Desulfuromonadaceae bacterium]